MEQQGIKAKLTETADGLERLKDEQHDFMERQEATNKDVRADITDLQGRTAEATIEAHKSGKVAQEAMAKAGQANARTRTLQVLTRREAGNTADAGGANANDGGGNATGRNTADAGNTTDAAPRPPSVAARVGNGITAGLGMAVGNLVAGNTQEWAIASGIGTGTLMYFAGWLVRRSLTYRFVAIFAFASMVLGYGVGIVVGFVYLILCILFGI